MHSEQRVGTVQLIKDNQHRILGQLAAVKSECQLHFAVCIRRCEGRFGGHFIPAEIEERRAGSLIHENTGDPILYTDRQIAVGDRVRDLHIICGKGGFAAVFNNSHGADLRVLQLDRLPLVFEVGVCCQLDTLMVKSLESYDFFAMQSSRIKGEFNRHRAGWFLRRKCNLRTDFFSGCVEEYLAGRLVHEYTGYGVLLAGLEIGIRYFIKNRYITERIDAVAILGGRCRANLRHADFNGLSFVIDLCMSCQLDVFTIERFENDHLCVLLEVQAAERKRHIYCAVCIRRCEGRFGGHFIPIKIKERFGSCLIHENTGYLVFLADLQAGIAHGIHQHNVLRTLRIFRAILKLCHRADLQRDVVEVDFGNVAFFQCDDLRIGESIAKGFLCIQFLDTVLVFGFTLVIFEDREGFGQDQAAGVRRVYLAVAVCKACHTKPNALNLTIVGGLNDLQLTAFQLVQKLVAVGLVVCRDHDLKIIDKLAASTTLGLMDNVRAIRHVFCYGIAAG